MQSKGLSRVFSAFSTENQNQRKISILQRSAFFPVHFPHPHVTLGIQDHLKKQVLERG